MTLATDDLVILRNAPDQRLWSWSAPWLAWLVGSKPPTLALATRFTARELELIVPFTSSAQRPDRASCERIVPSGTSLIINHGKVAGPAGRSRSAWHRILAESLQLSPALPAARHWAASLSWDRQGRSLDLGQTFTLRPYTRSMFKVSALCGSLCTLPAQQVK